MQLTRQFWGMAATCLLLAGCGAEVITSDATTDPTLSTPETDGTGTGWHLLAPKGSGPLEINASAHAPGLQAIFAARMWDYQAGTLWRFDLRTNSWRQLTATNWPLGKYRNLVYDATNRRLLTYWDGLGQVYSIPDTGGAWSPEGSAGNLDQYYEAYAFFNPASRRLAVFAGYGFGAWQDLLWEWDGAGSQWVNTPQSSPRPAPRFGHGPSTVAVDEGGKRAFLGQRSLGAASGGYDDLWSLDLRTNTWRNLIAPDSGANARLGSALAFASRTRLLYRFGGCSPIGGAGVCSTMTNELRSARPGSASPAWTRIRNTGSPPSPRIQAGLYYDAPRHRLILISGLDGQSWQDEAWSYKLP